MKCNVCGHDHAGKDGWGGGDQNDALPFLINSKTGDVITSSASLDQANGKTESSGVRFGTCTYCDECCAECAKGKPVIRIMRGVSGSGKSTAANALAHDCDQSLNAQGETVLAVVGVVFSTDDYFMKDGKYQFNASEIGKAHAWNQKRAFEAIKNHVDNIIIDNTNTQAWEAKPYVEAALKEGYRIEIIESSSPWWRKFRLHGKTMSPAEREEVAQECAKRNKHGVPVEAIRKMLDRWEFYITVDDILKSKGPKR